MLQCLMILFYFFNFLCCEALLIKLFFCKKRYINLCIIIKPYSVQSCFHFQTFLLFIMKLIRLPIEHSYLVGYKAILKVTASSN